MYKFIEVKNKFNAIFSQRVGLTGLNGPTVIRLVLKFVFATVTFYFLLGISVLETAVKSVPACLTPTLSQVDTHTHTLTYSSTMGPYSAKLGHMQKSIELHLYSI